MNPLNTLSNMLLVMNIDIRVYNAFGKPKINAAKVTIIKLKANPTLPISRSEYFFLTTIVIMSVPPIEPFLKKIKP